eukprot:PhF_6_TR3419/c0_g1_i1/m.4951
MASRSRSRGRQSSASGRSGSQGGTRRRSAPRPSRSPQGQSLSHSHTSSSSPPQLVAYSGPVIFTAPHGIQLYRDKGVAGEEENMVVHFRENYSTEIALALSMATARHLYDRENPTGCIEPVCGSFCVWDCRVAKPLDRNNLDPNYLIPSQFETSPWNQSLVGFQQHCRTHYASVVPLHVDIHGKINRKDNFDVDVGWASFKYLMSRHPGKVALFQRSLETHLSHALTTAKSKWKGYSPRAEMDPYLSGYWGGDIHTMTTQAVLLGMHSVQLEIPFSLREEFMKNDKLVEAMGAAFANVFRDIQDDPSVLGLLHRTATPNASKVFADATKLCRDTTNFYAKSVGKQ